MDSERGRESEGGESEKDRGILKRTNSVQLHFICACRKAHTRAYSTRKLLTWRSGTVYRQHRAYEVPQTEEEAATAVRLPMTPILAQALTCNPLKATTAQTHQQALHLVRHKQQPQRTRASFLLSPILSHVCGHHAMAAALCRTRARGKRRENVRRGSPSPRMRCPMKGKDRSVVAERGRGKWHEGNLRHEGRIW